MRARHTYLSGVSGLLVVTGGLLGPGPAEAQWTTDVTPGTTRSPVEPASPAVPPTGSRAEGTQLRAARSIPRPTATPAPKWPRFAPALPAARVNGAAVAARSPGEPTADPESWSKTDVELARARCRHLFKGLDLVTQPEDPLRSGQCGAPAPVELVSVGTNPQITFNPPVIVTCDMAVAVHGWVTKALQPLARQHLGSPLVAIETMSSYSCRNAYGRADTRLSEHGRANALDISAFVTANTQVARLIADWGTTERDRLQAIAAKQRQEQLEAARLAAEGHSTATAQQRPQALSPATIEETAEAAAGDPINAVRATIHEGMPKGLSILPDFSGESRSAFGISPSQLGGPGAGTGRRLAPPAILVETNGRRAATIDKSRFLREAHATACRIFGTVLGPEANNAHRNHFHVDLADRGGKNYCK